MPESQDAARPPWGPGFLSLASWPYRLEYAVATIAIFGVVFGWRMVELRDFPLSDVLLFVLFFLLPDLVAFGPIGLSRQPQGRWPSWGPALYNVMHSLLVWAAVALLVWVLRAPLFWPFMGWAAHITMDRAAGYHLRARAQPEPSGSD